MADIKKIATRDSYGNALKELGAQHDDLIVFTTAPETSLSALEDFLVAKTSLHPSCFTIRSIAAIPKNSSGKTQYTDLPGTKD